MLRGKTRIQRRGGSGRFRHFFGKTQKKKKRSTRGRPAGAGDDQTPDPRTKTK